MICEPIDPSMRAPGERIPVKLLVRDHVAMVVAPFWIVVGLNVREQFGGVTTGASARSAK